MPNVSRTFRIFVSSTFSDLKAERNALQQYVFPRLRELAQAHGCRFQEIDLRWGVSEEAALDQQTMKICLTEIERCQKVTPRPNFVILLGERYGWRPLPASIPAEEYEAIAAILAGRPVPQNRSREDSGLISGIKRFFRRSVESEAPVTPGNPHLLVLLQEWYRLDTNAVPAEYVLQPRQKGSHFEDYATWESQVERPLLQALEGSARLAGLAETAMVKYTHSATGQEIVQGALGVANAAEHVFGFFRSIENSEVLEKANNTAYIEADPELAERQHALKGRLRERLPGNIHEYQACWDGKALSTGHIGSLPETLEDCLKLNESPRVPQTLCEAVWLRLSQVIVEQVGQLETLDALGGEITAHAEFRQEHLRFFTSREEPLQRITAYLHSMETRTLGIWGESGTGKSALMARAIQQAEESPGRGNPVILARFIGATPDSANIRSLLEGLCRQLTRAYAEDEGTIPLTYEELVQELPKRLRLAKPGRPAWLFLDALDQLSPADNAHLLAWLPSELPTNVKVVVSSPPGECKGALDRLGALKLPLKGLKLQAGEALLEGWLKAARRTLTNAQRADLLRKFNAGGGLPLYLKLAFEEARRWHSYDGLPWMFDQEPGLSRDIIGVIGDLFSRLSQESQHGEMLVAHALGYLAAGKNGLTEDELLKVLWRDETVRQDFFKRSPKSPQELQALPVVIWARLYMDLEAYMVERNADGVHTLAFYHRQLCEAVQARYLARNERTARHRSLADFFSDQPTCYLMPAGQLDNLRKLSELPYQLAGGGLWKELKATLLDYTFLYGKTKAIGAQALLEDYDLFDDRQPASSRPPAHYRLKRALHQAASLLAINPEQLPSQLWGRLCDRDEPELQALLQQTLREHTKPWLRPTTPSLTDDENLVRTFIGHTGSVNACALTPDGRQVISASSDKTLKLWDLTTGACLRTFEGHALGVNALVVTPDGRQVISASSDQSLKLWDLASGACLRTFQGHTHFVNACAITANGRQIVSSSCDKTLKLWDLNSGTCLRTFEGHTYYFDTIRAINRDGRLVVSSSDNGTLKLWNLANGACLRTFVGHTSWVSACALTPDECQIISASNDQTLKLWDISTSLDTDASRGVCLRTFEGHTQGVRAFTLTPDRRQIISASWDHTLKLWDIASGACLSTFVGHASWVSACALTPDGRHVISASGDSTLKLWDVASGTCLRTFNSRSGGISNCVLTPDGCQVISSSMDNRLILWDIPTALDLGFSTAFDTGAACNDRLSVIDCLRIFEEQSYHLEHWELTPDGCQVITTSEDNTLNLWDLSRGTSLRTFEGHTDLVSDFDFTPDGRQLVSASGDLTLKLWDIASGAYLRTFKGHNGPVFACAVTPDGSMIISASRDKTLKIWDLAKGNCLRTLEGHKDSVNHFDLTPDGRQIVSVSDDRTLKLWDLVSGICLHTFEVNYVITSCMITPDGSYVISISNDNILRLWDLASGACIRKFLGITRSVLTSDGRQFVSASHDNSLKLWDLASGACLCTFAGNTSSVLACVLTPDGHKVVSTSKDGRVKLWDLETGALQATFVADGLLNSCAVTPDGCTLVCSGSSDRLHILRLEGMNL